MIKFNHAVRASVLAAAICSAAFAGPALAVTYTYAQLQAANMDVNNASYSYTLTEDAYNQAVAHQEYLGYEYIGERESCFAAYGNTDPTAYCLNEKLTWYQRQVDIRQQAVWDAQEAMATAWDAYMNALNIRDAIAADCCTT